MIIITMACANNNGSHVPLLSLYTENEICKNHKLVQKELHSISQSNPNTRIISKDERLEVLLQPVHQQNIYLRILLQAGYPEVPPEISISSDCLTKTETANLQKLLTGKALISKGQPMLVTLMSEACQYLHKSDQAIAIPVDYAAKKPKQKSNKQLEKKAKDISNVTLGKERKNQKGEKRIPISDFNDSETKLDGLNPSLNIESSPMPSPTVKRPTHFIAIRINDQTVVETLMKVQKQLVNKEPLLSKGLFAKEIFHLTLCSLGLDTVEDIVKCVKVLDNMKPDLKAHLPQSNLLIHGISQFYNRAIFAKVTHGDDFLRFHQMLRDRLKYSDVEIRDDHAEFNPHVTLVKLKRPERKLLGNRNIEPSIYSHVKETVFGAQTFYSLYLCPMDGQRRPDGFYMTLHEVNLE
ncbi:uncharacterized protein LOC106065245 isoform X2 [Biomphalaria glabrata]|uniref:Uncharacterized protein LOC106065245 isoform X2 n=1 Tax=Biomphalaria glabrata TaxID=6526 RepID=A0A9W3BBI2_BIOGL|nr:uncharacterized protein LOC106065245 isoform X2 [Biomphalaria glabrata]